MARAHTLDALPPLRVPYKHFTDSTPLLSPPAGSLARITHRRARCFY